MAPYLFFYLLLAICAVGEVVRRDRVFVAIALVAVALFAGLRFETGYDWYAYELFYGGVDDLPSIVSNLSLLTGYSFEPGYSLLNAAVKTSGGGLVLVFLTAASLQSFALWLFLRRYARRPMLVMLGYVAVCYLVGQFIMIRFSVAAGFMLLAIGYGYERRYLPAAFLFLAALSFHISVCSFLVLPLLSNSRIGKALVACSVVAFFASLSSGSAFQEWVFSFLGEMIGRLVGGNAQPLLGKILVYTEFTAAVSATSLVFALLNLLFYCGTFTDLFRVWKTDREELLIRIARSLTVLFLLSILLFPQLQTLWNRMMLVAFPFQMVVLSNAVRFQSPLRLCNVYLASYLVSAVVFGYSLLKPDPNLFLPYESTIQAHLFGSDGEKRMRMLDFF